MSCGTGSYRMKGISNWSCHTISEGDIAVHTCYRLTSKLNASAAAASPRTQFRGMLHHSLLFIIGVPIFFPNVLHGSHSHPSQASCPSTLTEVFMPRYCGLPVEILPLTSNCFQFCKHPCSKFDEYYDLHTLPCSDAIQQDILISSGVWDSIFLYSSSALLLMYTEAEN
jgi:hypothetical protein